MFLTHIEEPGKGQLKKKKMEGRKTPGLKEFGYPMPGLLQAWFLFLATSWTRREDFLCCLHLASPHSRPHDLTFTLYGTTVSSPQVYGFQPTLTTIQSVFYPLNSLGNWNGLHETDEDTKTQSY